MFKLKEPNYKIKQVKFKCDKPFSKRIKEPFPNSSFFICILGPPGSGKTTLLINMITNKNIYYCVFDKIILVMPNSSIDSIENNIFEGIEHYDKFDPYKIQQRLEEINDKFKEHMKKDKRKRNILLVLDDITASLKNADIEAELKNLTMNRRHMNLSIILLSQYLHSIPRAVRTLLTTLIVFTPPNKDDDDILYKEYIRLDKKLFQKLMQFVFQEEHDFLVVDKKKNLYYKNFSRIEIEN
jgi:RecA/RadA recombinase